MYVADTRTLDEILEGQVWDLDQVEILLRACLKNHPKSPEIVKDIYRIIIKIDEKRVIFARLLTLETGREAVLCLKGSGLIEAFEMHQSRLNCRFEKASGELRFMIWYQDQQPFKEFLCAAIDIEPDVETKSAPPFLAWLLNLVSRRL